MGVSAAPGDMQQQQQQQSQTGDVNRDGSVNYLDVLELKKVVLGISELDNRNQNRADLSGDGQVNAIDVAMLKAILFQNGEVVEPQPEVTTEVATTVTTTIPEGETTTTTTVVTEAPEVVQDAVSFKFSNVGVTAYDADGNEVDSKMVSGTTVTITVPGEYSFEGECEDGQIVVNVDKTTYPKSGDVSAVTLSLQGLTLSNSSTSPIYVESIDDVCEISSKKGTTNTISDGTSYTNADGGVGAIYSKDDLKFKGKGELVVNGNCEDGIVSKNDIRIWNSTITVNAVDDGIRGKDSVRIGDPDTLVANGGDGDYSNLSVTVNSTSGDGIKSTNYEDEGDGKININGGTINVTAYGDGIQAEQEININGGDINIKTTGTVSSSSSSSQGGWNQGGWGNSSSTSNDVSAKGIKTALDDSSTLSVTPTINITGGTIKVDSTDDSVHSNGDVNITGGIFTLTSGDDGVHADGTLTIGTTGGALDELAIYITDCYEGIEGCTINQNAGTVIVNSQDDGYNAAGGADSSGNSSPGGWSQGGWGGSSSSYAMNLNGGFVLVNAQDGDHDGYDSNGTLTISGGYFISNGNDAFDSDGTMSCTGGVWVANVGSQMSNTYPSSTVVSASGSVSQGDRITIADESGNVIVSFLAGKSISSVMAGGSGMGSSSAVVYIGGTLSDATLLENTGNQECAISGTISGGTQLTGSSSGNQGGGRG
jgi:hypothetical protein